MGKGTTCDGVSGDARRERGEEGGGEEIAMAREAVAHSLQLPLFLCYSFFLAGRPSPPVSSSPRSPALPFSLSRVILSSVLWSGLDGCWRSQESQISHLKFEIDETREESPNTAGQRTG